MSTVVSVTDESQVERVFKRLFGLFQEGFLKDPKSPGT